MPLGVSEKFFANKLGQLGFADLAGTERVDADADRFGDADGVGKLDLGAVGEAGGDDVFGDVARDIGCRAVDLGRILTRESSAAVTAGSAVGIYDDFAAGEAGVAHRSADDEAAGGVDVVLGMLVEPRGREHGLDHMLENVGVEIVVGDGLGMLAGDDDGVDAGGLPFSSYSTVTWLLPSGRR